MMPNDDVALEGFGPPPTPAPQAEVSDDGHHRIELPGGLHVGLDPGLTGWWAIIDATGSDLVDCGPLPVLEGGKGKSYDLHAMWRLVQTWRGRVALVTIERQHARGPTGPPCKACKKRRGGMTAKSQFLKGDGYGIVRMALTAAGLRWEDVPQQTWKKAMGIQPTSGLDSKKREKEAKRLSISKAQALYPAVDFRREPGNGRMKPDHNKAEAVLLACHGYRQRLGVL